MGSSGLSVLVCPRSVFAETRSARSAASRASRITVRTKYDIAIRSRGQLRKSAGRQLVAVNINSGYFGTVIHLASRLSRRPQSEADATRGAIAGGEPATYRQVNPLLVRAERCYRA